MFKKLLTLTIVLVAMIPFVAEAETPKPECSRRCASRFDQCVHDAIEYGYTREQANAGCEERRISCLKNCR
jgi:hypothetical protein